MAGKPVPLHSTAVGRDRAPDSEKITINLGPVDLGQIDLLVVEGFFSNRTDFIRTAIRNQLAVHADPIRQTIARKTLTVGLRDIGKQELEQVVAAGGQLRLHVLGLVRIADDVSPRLARAAIESLEILGALTATSEVKAALLDRIL
jgi:Arc/MetJ-type ribon-helix-helix transcriptional regulator